MLSCLSDLEEKRDDEEWRTLPLPSFGGELGTRSTAEAYLKETRNVVQLLSPFSTLSRQLEYAIDHVNEEIAYIAQFFGAL